ncbi:MAG: LptF/LptG family permease [Treponema sp.]|jgi:lipopolysaccharide export system permease protein|nr:LptF/LptG family permease [Treponema sp.]
MKRTGGRFLSRTVFLYIVREILFTFLVCFLFFFVIFFVNQILLMAQQILSKRVPFHLVSLLMLYSLPQIIALAAPFAALSGTLMTIGRLSSDNEILIFLSSGLSYRNIIGPALAVGILISLLSFAANDVLLPAGMGQFTKLYRRIMIASPALEMESNSVKRFKNTLMVSGSVSGSTIKDLVIMDRTNEGERRIILAKEAALKDSGMEGISIELKDAFTESVKENSREDYDYTFSSLLSYTVPQEDLAQSAVFITPNQMSSVDVKREIRNHERTLDENINLELRRNVQAALKVEAALRFGTAGADWNLVSPLWEDYTNRKAALKFMRRNSSLSNYRLEYYKKFSIPFGALSFVFLAVSLGLAAKKSGQTVGFIIGICISVLYWALLLGGQTLGTKTGFSPLWSMWFPNALALTSGGVLLFLRIRA